MSDAYAQPSFKGVLVPKTSEYGKYIPEIARQIKGKSILYEHEIGQILGYIEDAKILPNGDLGIMGRLSSGKGARGSSTTNKRKMVTWLAKTTLCWI